MTDHIDQAQAREQLDREFALQAHEQRVQAQPRDVTTVCVDCDEPIEPARLRALRGCTSRCASCAREFEQRMNMGRP